MKVLVTGSRAVNKAMLEYARRCVNRAKDLGYSIIVGDAPGIDQAVIRQCDDVGVHVEVFGAYNKLRNRSTTGENNTMPESYSERDQHMVGLCDICVAIWNGKSRGTVKTYNSALMAGKDAHLVNFLQKQ